jgi:hypothetical protein
MPTISTIVVGFVLPVFLTAAGLAVAWRVWNPRATADGRWIGGPLLGAALAMAFWNLRAKPHFPPGTGEVIEWFFWLAVGLGILGWFDAVARAPFWLRAIVVLFIWRLAMRLMLWPLMTGTLSLPEEWIDFLSLGAMVWWWSVETVAANSSGLSAPLLLLILCGGSAAMLASWHIVGSAMVAAAVAMICGGVAVIAFWRGRVSLDRGAVGAVALTLLALLVHGYFYTGDTLSRSQQIFAVVLLVSPMLALGGDLPAAAKLRPGWRLAVRLLPVILAVGVAAGMSLREAARADQAQQQDE